MIARLRLLLAILLLTLAPMMAPADAAVRAADHHACLHSCDTSGPVAFAQPACACAAHAVLAPLMPGPLPAPVAVAFAHAVPVDGALAPARWPPPLRPPRG